MSNNFVQVPPNSTGLKMQTFENTVGANVVESEAVTLVRSSDNTEVGTSGQPLRVDPTGTTVQPVNTISNDLVDTNNSSISTLGAGGVFTGTSTITTGYAQLIVTVDTDQVSASNAGSTGLVVQWSEDNSNWSDFDWAAIGSSDIGSVGQTLAYGIKRKYYRVVYTNGATPQGFFRLQSILKVNSGVGRIMDLIDTIDPNTHAQIVRNVPFGHSTNGSGTFNDVVVKNPSTAAVASDPSLVVTMSPNTATVPVSLTSTGITGNVTVIQGTGTNLHAVLDTGSTTAVTQATGSNLHTVLDSGTLTGITNPVTVAQATAANLNATVSGSVTVASGSITATQGTGANLHTVVDSGSITVTQGTGSNLHTVVDSGTITTVSTVTAVTGITNALPSGSNTIGAVKIIDTGGTNLGSVKAASTGAATTDTSLVVQLNPVQPNLTSPLNVSVSNSPAVTVSSGSITAVQGTGTNLHTVVDSGSITAVQATGTNLHTVVDSGTVSTITNPVTVAQATPANLTATVTQGPAATAANAWTAKVTDGTTVAGVIAGTTALKIDASSQAGTAITAVPVAFGTGTPSLNAPPVNAAAYVGTTPVRSNQTTTATGVIDINNVGLNGTTLVTAAAGVQKVGIVGNAGATIDAAVGTLPTNSQAFIQVPTAGAGGALSASVKSAQATAVNIKASSGNLYGFAIVSATATAGFIMFFDTATTATTGTVWAIPIAASGTVIIPPGNIAFRNFVNGIAINVANPINGTTTQITWTGTIMFM